MAKAKRLEDLQLIVTQTLEQLQELQRYVPDILHGFPIMYRDTNGGWVDADDIAKVIKDLRRAMGDSILSEKVSDGKSS